MDSDSSMTLATSPGYLHYPPPTVYLADAHSGNHSKLANELHLVSLQSTLWCICLLDEYVFSILLFNGHINH